MTKEKCANRGSERRGVWGAWKVISWKTDRRVTQNNTNMDLRAIGYKGGDGINLAEERDKWTVTELWVQQNAVKFLTS